MKKYSYDLDTFKNIAKKRGGICISTNENIKYKDKLTFKCSDGHFFEKKAELIHIGKWCPKCIKYISEELSRYIFEQSLNVKFEKYYFKFENHNLELDGYNEKYKIAFEYNGKQHYKLTAYTKTNDDLEYRKYLDSLKIKYCIENAIKLIIIPYTIKNDNLSEFILTNLKGLNINNIKKVDTETFINTYSYYVLRKEKIIELLHIKEGVLLDFKFNSIKVKCKYGHVWNTTFTILKKNHWCNICNNNKRKPEKVLKLLSNKGIQCLNIDNYYDGNSVLMFKCENNHIFNEKVDYIISKTHKNRKPCKHCNYKKVYNILDKIKGCGLEIIDIDKYIDRNTETLWKCKNGHIHIEKLKNLAQRIRSGTLNLCNTCKLNINDISLLYEK